MSNETYPKNAPDGNTNRRMAVRKVLLGLACGIALLCSGNSFAQQKKVDASQSGQIPAAPSTTPSATDADLIVILPQQLDPPSLQVDQTYCATGGIQCVGAGHTFEAAGPGNHNPVRIGIQVQQGGMPVDGLASTDFTVLNPFVPAGGPGVTKLACASCFQAAGQGLYTLFVHPAAVGVNWKSGSYFVQIQVRLLSGTRTIRGLTKIEIPF
jgi:hypothetical protein